jgi:hypothetical protein
MGPPATTLVIQVRSFTGSKAKAAAVVSELGVGCRGKEPAIVEAVENLAVEGFDADAEFGVAQSWIGENKLNFVS